MKKTKKFLKTIMIFIMFICMLNVCVFAKNIQTPSIITNEDSEEYENTEDIEEIEDIKEDLEEEPEEDEVETEAESENETEAELETETEKENEAESEIEVESETETEKEDEKELETEVETETEEETEVEFKTEIETEAESTIENKKESEAEIETETETETETEIESEIETKEEKESEKVEETEITKEKETIVEEETVKEEKIASFSELTIEEKKTKTFKAGTPGSIYMYLDSSIPTKLHYTSQDTVGGTPTALYDGGTPGSYSGNNIYSALGISGSSITEVVIDDDIYPISCRDLFCDFSQITEIKNLNKLHTDNTTCMEAMFANCSNLTTLDLSKFNVSNVTNMDYMLMRIGATNINLSSWKTESLESTYAMFNECNNLQSINLSNFDMTNNTNAFGMFYNCSNLTTITVGNKFTLPTSCNSTKMFEGCTSLPGYDPTKTDGTMITIYTKKAEEYITVKINGNGGTVNKNSIKIKVGDKFTSLNSISAEKSGYTFVKWNTTSNGSGQTITANTVATAGYNNKTIFAIWEKKYIPSGNTGRSGGSSGGGGGVPIYNQDGTIFKPSDLLESPMMKDIKTESYDWVKLADGSWTLTKTDTNGNKHLFAGEFVTLERIINNEKVPCLYYFDVNGKMHTGLLTMGNSTYYFSPYENENKGNICNGWHVINGKYYYFGQGGVMLKNTTTPDGYRVDANGVWIR